MISVGADAISQLFIKDMGIKTAAMETKSFIPVEEDTLPRTECG